MHALEPGFFVDRDTALDAVRASRAFNVFHRKGAFKFDLFPVCDDFSRQQIARRIWVQSDIPGLQGIEFAVASAEDTILAKLVWFRKGGEASERQWHDILGVVAVQGARLDQAYLREWADRLGVSDLLTRVTSSST